MASNECKTCKIWTEWWDMVKPFWERVEPTLIAESQRFYGLGVIPKPLPPVKNRCPLCDQAVDIASASTDS